MKIYVYYCNFQRIGLYTISGDFKVIFKRQDEWLCHNVQSVNMIAIWINMEAMEVREKKRDRDKVGCLLLMFRWN